MLVSFRIVITITTSNSIIIVIATTNTTLITITIVVIIWPVTQGIERLMLTQPSKVRLIEDMLHGNRKIKVAIQINKDKSTSAERIK